MSVSLEWIFILLILFQFKHFIGDFPLQNNYMMGKARADWTFVVPLGLHCGVHALLTLAIIWPLKPHLWWLAPVDFVTHFIMDRIKSGPKYLGRYTDHNRAIFWNAFGVDQMVHHITGLYIVWRLVQP